MLRQDLRNFNTDIVNFHEVTTLIGLMLEDGSKSSWWV